MDKTKNIFEIFDENLIKLKNQVDEKNYNNCFRITIDLTRISTLSNFKDGLLISEILENVFQQIDSIIIQYIVEKEETDELNRQVTEILDIILKSYKDESKQNLYDALKELRYIATQFQFKNWHTKKQKISGTQYMVKA